MLQNEKFLPEACVEWEEVRSESGELRRVDDEELAPLSAVSGAARESVDGSVVTNRERVAVAR